VSIMTCGVDAYSVRQCVVNGNLRQRKNFSVAVDADFLFGFEIRDDRPREERILGTLSKVHQVEVPQGDAAKVLPESWGELAIPQQDGAAPAQRGLGRLVATVEAELDGAVLLDVPERPASEDRSPFAEVARIGSFEPVAQHLVPCQPCHVETGRGEVAGA